VRTNISIEEIVDKMKDELQYEALCIIKPTIKDSVERREKPIKDMGSTLPASLEKKSLRDTPGFDLPSSKSRSKEMTIDLRQFTLGQREQGSSNRSKTYREEGSEVSEFSIPSRDPTSRKIKDRVMNPNKHKK